jgi:hypothetical protein
MSDEVKIINTFSGWNVLGSINAINFLVVPEYNKGQIKQG